MSVDPMMVPPSNGDLDAMAMQGMMGSDPAMAAGGEDELVPVQVPAWTVPAVEELVDLLMASEEAEMSGDMGGGMPPMM
jgi:hypothetical protein